MAKRGPKTIELPQETPLRGVPQAPSHLTVAERKHWREVTGLIHEAGLLSGLDRDALTVYVSLWSRWRHAESKIETTGGLVVEAHNKCLVPNPWYTIAKDTQREMTKYLDMFGLSPKARTKLKAAEPEEVDERWKDFA